MIDKETANALNSDGYLVAPCPALDGSEIQQAFRAFIRREREHQLRFLQKEYGYAYDGFSYYGQTDSSHQAHDDLISTFVLSEFYPVERFPPEFHGFLNSRWQEVVQVVRGLETELLTQLDVPGLLYFYLHNVGHMLSNNYYPPLQQFTTTAAGNTRLSAHPDASLFTVFPFGIDQELELQLTGEDGGTTWQSVDASDAILLYPGYLLEMWTRGEIKAMNHRVRLSADRAAERFSFSCFSLPFPLRKFEMPGRGPVTSEEYFEAYGTLF